MNRERSHRFLTIPNLLSILRILLIFPLAIFFWHNMFKAIIILIIIAVISDYLDGIIARRFNQISDWGKILDPLADKLSIGIMLILLYLKQQVPFWLVLVVVGRDLAILLAGLFIVEKYKLVTASNFLGKLTANVLALMVISYIFNIELLEKMLTPIGVAMVILSSYNYLNIFIKLQKMKTCSNQR